MNTYNDMAVVRTLVTGCGLFLLAGFLLVLFVVIVWPLAG